MPRDVRTKDSQLMWPRVSCCKRNTASRCQFAWVVCAFPLQRLTTQIGRSVSRLRSHVKCGQGIPNLFVLVGSVCVCVCVLISRFRIAQARRCRTRYGRASSTSRPTRTTPSCSWSATWPRSQVRLASRHVTSSHVGSRLVESRGIAQHLVVSGHVSSHCVSSRRVTSRRGGVTFRHVVRQHVTEPLVALRVLGVRAFCCA